MGVARGTKNGQKVCLEGDSGSEGKEKEVLKAIEP